MPLDDARGDRKTESGTGLFGGEKRIEELLLQLRGNARAGIFNFDKDAGLAFVLNHASAFTDPQSHRARMEDALGGVADQDNEHLFELMPIGADVCLGDLFKLEVDRALRMLALHKLVDL